MPTQRDARWQNCGDRGLECVDGWDDKGDGCRRGKHLGCCGGPGAGLVCSCRTPAEGGERVEIKLVSEGEHGSMTNCYGKHDLGRTCDKGPARVRTAEVQRPDHGRARRMPLRHWNQRLQMRWGLRELVDDTRWGVSAFI